MPDASPELISVLRDEAFSEIERVAGLAASYARSAGEAAFRGDERTMVIHLKQLRLCCIAMLKTHKENMNGSDLAAGAGPSRPGGQDQRPGDGVA